MNSFPRILLMMGVAASLFAVNAKADFRDYNSKAWAQAGRHHRGQSYRQNQSVYRSSAPVVVRTESAPTSVAQAPTEERRFSYEPSQQAQSGSPRPEEVTATPAPEATKQPTNVDTTPRATQSYSGPHRRSARPKYLLPKTDPNKYRN